MQSHRVLVTGATGFIGRHVVEQLLHTGKAVRILTRGSRIIPESWSGRVEITAGELNHPASLKRAVLGCQIVFHLAAELRNPAKMASVNAEGTRLLLKVCSEAGVHALVQLSSVGVMGASRPGDVDEYEPCRPLNPYEKSKYAAEKLVQAWSKHPGNRVVIIRPTNVFGDGPRGGQDSMLSWLRAVQKRKFVFFDRHAVSNYVYVKDVAEACCLAASSTRSGIFIVNDPCKLVDFVSAAAEVLGVPVPRFRIPLPIAIASALAFQGAAYLMRRRSPLTISRVRALSVRTRYLPDRIKTAVGWHPAVGYRLGLQHTVNWYRQTKQI